MGLSALVAICFATLFYRAAMYERMSGWAWAVVSLFVSMILVMLAQGLGVLILAQVGLYVVMWWYNAQRHGNGKQSG